MKKVISFSLWGSNPIYCVGAIRNAELAMKHYPGWICRYHVGKSVPEFYVEDLLKQGNVEINLRKELGDWTGMFWRFEDASDPDVSVMVSRDTDSRIDHREAQAVQQWLASDKDFHIMRDHPYHATEILGGMWGVKNPLLSGMKDMIENYVKGNFWQVDQNFLREIIWPIVHDKYMVHDEYFEKKSFPTPRENKRFVGQAFDNNDNLLNPEHTELL
jgi:protein O-GlcNAc transferase